MFCSNDECWNRKIENFYIKNEHDDSNVLNEDSLGTLQISLLKDNDKRTVGQQFYSHKYQLKYTCKLIENPLKKNCTTK